MQLSFCHLCQFDPCFQVLAARFTALSKRAVLREDLLGSVNHSLGIAHRLLRICSLYVLIGSAQSQDGFNPLFLEPISKLVSASGFVNTGLRAHHPLRNTFD